MTDVQDRQADQPTDGARVAAQQALIVRATETLSELLETQGVSKSVLAERMGTTKGYVSQVLSGSRNMTLRTLADICFALGVTPNFVVSQAGTGIPSGRAGVLPAPIGGNQ